MTETLGKAVLQLDVDMRPLERGEESVRRSSKRIDDDLEKVAAFAKRATERLHGIEMRTEQALRSGQVSDKIKRALSEIGYSAQSARADLDRVKLGTAQALETETSGQRIEHEMREIVGEANEARRALESVRLAGVGAGGGPGGPGGRGGNRNPGSGFGPFGSGFGRIGVLGAAVGGAALLGPAAGPAALGLLASIPTLATAGAGALGVLALGFAGVGKAIGGDLKAFKQLQPAQQQFVLTVRSLTGWLRQLKQTAGESLFPGLTRGLKAALSPGTLGAITEAVKEFGTAIGNAGEQWGKYFGSAQFQNIFGPLMSAGAQTLTTLSGAALNLFDALGVLGRAGIPFVSWLTDAAAAGSRFIESMTRSADAAGALGRGFDEAKTSLRLVAQLGLSLTRVVAALGRALYPVSQVAVGDLTDGLNALARIIDRNRGKIQEIVGGALAALRSTVETVTPLIEGMAKGLDLVAEAIGGWKTAFELVIGGYLALKLLSVADAITKIGTASGEAGAAGETGLLLSRLSLLATMAPIAVAITLLITNKDEIENWLERHHIPFAHDSGVDIAKKALGRLGIGGGKPPAPSGSTLSAQNQNATHLRIDPATGKVIPWNLGKVTPPKPQHYSITGGDAPAEFYIPDYVDNTMSPDYDLWGNKFPFTKNLGPKPHKHTPSALDIVFPPRMQAALSNARAAAAGGSMGGLERLLAVAKKSLDYLDAEHRTGKKLVALNRERATIATLIASTEQKIYRLQIAIPQRLQDALANAKSALGSTSASPLSAESLNARAAALAKIVTVEDKILDRLKQQHVTGKALVALQKELGQHTTARDKALAQARTTALNAGSASMAERILGIAGESGPGAQLASLRGRERSILTKALSKAGVQRGSFDQLSLDQLLERAHNVLGVGLPKSVYHSLQTVNKVFTLGLKGVIGQTAIDNLRQRFQQITQTMAAGFDGFNLTLAEKSRHFLDARYADVYHDRAGSKAGGKPPVVYAPTFHSTDPAAMERKARADYFRFRLQMAG